MLLGTFQNHKRPRVTLQNQKNLKVKCLRGATSSYKVKYTWFFTVQEKARSQMMWTCKTSFQVKWLLTEEKEENV